MSADLVTPPSELPAERLTWYQTWILALTRPSVATFGKITRDPDASSRRAYIWILITSFIGEGISLLAASLLPSINTRKPFTAGSLLDMTLFAFTSVFLMIIYTSIIHWTAKILGGKGAFSNLVYAFSAFIAPLALITPALSSPTVGIFGCFASLLGLFGLILNVIAVKAVHQLGWGKSIVSVLALMFLAIILTVCIILFVGANNLPQ